MSFHAQYIVLIAYKQIYMLSHYIEQVFLEYEPKTHQHVRSQNISTGKKYN